MRKKIHSASVSLNKILSTLSSFLFFASSVSYYITKQEPVNWLVFMVAVVVTYSLTVINDILAYIINKADDKDGRNGQS